MALPTRSTRLLQSSCQNYTGTGVRCTEPAAGWILPPERDCLVMLMCQACADRDIEEYSSKLNEHWTLEPGEYVDGPPNPYYRIDLEADRTTTQVA